MANPIPTPASADSTGLPDSQWIGDVRDALRDYPDPVNDTWTADGVGGVFGAAAAPFKASKGPIYDPDSSVLANYIKVSDTTTPTNYTVITSGTPTGTQVLVNFDARTFTWASPPTNAHTIAFGYHVVKWRDASILTALMAGLRAMFPSVGKTYVDTTTLIAVNAWDYVLPVWAQSPEAQISKVEYQSPAISTEPWRPLNNWMRVGGINLLHVPQSQRMNPGAKLRITGWGPFLTLGDMEPDLYHLPIWYALHVLNAKQESKRLREDTMIPLTQAGGQQPGLLMQAGINYKNLFDAALEQKKRAYGPPGAARAILTSYQVASHS